MNTMQDALSERTSMRLVVDQQDAENLNKRDGEDLRWLLILGHGANEGSDQAFIT